MEQSILAIRILFVIEKSCVISSTVEHCRRALNEEYDKRNCTLDSGTKSIQHSIKRMRKQRPLTCVSHETSKPAHIGHFFHLSIIPRPRKRTLLKEDICVSALVPAIVRLYRPFRPPLRWQFAPVATVRSLVQNGYLM